MASATRNIWEGDEYEIGEDVNLIQLVAALEPPVNVQGEPWGWPDDKPERPRGWREDGNYDGTH